MYLAVLILGLVMMLGGCATSAQRRQAENTAELDRICSLPQGEREEALKKWKEKTGMIAFCGRAEPAEPEG